MSPFVAAVVLFAAVTHASWNAITHRIKDELACLSLVGAGRTLSGAVLACLAPLPAPAAWPYLIASVLLHIGYQVALMRSFRLGDFGQVYPIARGTAPLLVTLFAVLALDEHLGGASAAGVLVATAGIVGLALWGVRDRANRPSGPAVAMAAATGLMIAVYTVVDGVGVREAGAALGYIAWLMVLDGLAIPAYAAVRLRGALTPRLRPVLLPGLVGGVLSVLSYGLVLWAQTRAPLAPVAVLREFSVIAGAVIAAFLFKERFGGPRMAAAAVMVTGIALMLGTL
ncbi:EamA family transporter [Streptomyces sp. NPDC059506]|uniref:DMT family transporter n=1 Tax=Streptomyces TaxID=1883 RepID=UPI000CBF4A35|nr:MULTISPECIES: DMT family transporter [unclassified Streptomyces]MCZ2526767.1 DMT family transporter [Streptomyces sp. HB2AG]PLW71945.1 EamA family transporter [Streptomyces sp. DJ]QMV23158.1 EamA family transporter [Streptomyces sp. SCUT-3]